MARAKPITMETLAKVLDPGHVIGPLTDPNAHGVRTAVCVGCGGLVVVHSDGKVDPERFLLSMECEQAQRIHAAADAVVGKR